MPQIDLFFFLIRISISPHVRTINFLYTFFIGLLFLGGIVILPLKYPAVPADFICLSL